MNKLVLLFTLLCFMISSEFIVFDFSKQKNLSSWRVVDDVVMGGVSDGNLKINSKGNGLFYGNVSTENNGGFSSIRYQFNKIDVSNYSKIVLKLKGDGNNYQFRVKDDSRNYFSYIKEFSTTKDWTLIEIDLSEMYPAFRGRTLNKKNFSSNKIEEIAILIGNKKEQSFQLEIDKIYLK